MLNLAVYLTFLPINFFHKVGKEHLHVVPEIPDRPYVLAKALGRDLHPSVDIEFTGACGIFHDPVHVTDELVERVYTMLADRKYLRFLLRVAKATRDRYMLDELADVQVPTMIIWGRNDTITPPFVAEQFCRKIRGAELAFIDECGHAPPIEQPKEFARLLHAFRGGRGGGLL